MPKRVSKELSDPVQNAFRVVQESTEESEISLTVVSNPSLLSQVMAAIGRKGGKIGGKRRLKTLSPERRKQIAQLAAKKRWDTVRKAEERKAAKKAKKSA
ncbi:MAG: hypothetical protein JO336_19945 [Acidobacteriia bacterium]|nr:hypothetical protein [Terriglobia bacterium]